ncbi:hypothetical protein [Metabacillus fastidiosus]|uniref:hypothetical protein n=1 Tax=Metabacillus fastidiosus TaxID=1458 RepID=UPI002E230DF8|nr:hypothetical protein [Metabacillus fastidiosus]
MNYEEYWEKIYEKRDELNSLFSAYWDQYSSLGNWQFWVVLFLFIFPLVLLYFKIDRTRVFEILFFGYTVHLLWAYTDITLGRSGYFVHTYFLMPIFPNASNMTASVLPVSFLLLYQYCTNHKKNFYLYAIILSAVFAFGFASIEEYFGLVNFRRGMNQFYLFLIDVGAAFISYWFTNLILKCKK